MDTTIGRVTRMRLFQLLLACAVSPVALGQIGINGEECQFSEISSAIAQANDGDVILIDHGIYIELLDEIDLSLTFAPALPLSKCTQEDSGADSNDVIIDGDGDSADGTGGLVEVTGGATVTFRHMWLRNATATNGGVIAVTDGSSLTLDDVLVTDGEASAAGGDIYLIAGSQTSKLQLINDSSVYRGTTPNGDGGAIALFGSVLTIDDGNIGVSNNNGFSTAGNNGGGIYAQDSSIELTSDQARIIWNEAGNFGGGIYAQDSRVIASDGLISNNTATFSGGGIFMEGSDASLSLTDVAMDANATTTFQTNMGGGAVHLLNADGTFDGVTLTNNQAINSGGAIYGRGISDVLIRGGSVLDGNTAGTGGALMIWRNLTLEDSSVINNVASNNGGGIYCFTCSSLNLENAIVANNEGADGGGMYVLGNATNVVNITGGSFVSNDATSTVTDRGLGGAIRAFSTTMTITGTSFQGNSARLSGGAIHLNKANNHPMVVTLNQAIIADNSTTQFQTNEGGGGLYAGQLDSITINSSTFVENQSTNLGGGLLVRTAGQVEIDGTQFDLNTAGLAAGAYISSADAVNVTDSQFTGNVSNGSGGGLYMLGVDAAMIDASEFLGNEARFGAGLYVWFTTAVVRNSRFNFNMANDSGGGVYSNSSDLDLGTDFSTCNPLALAPDDYCSVIDGNSAAEFGGGVYVTRFNSSTAGVFNRVADSAIRNNNAGMAGTAVYVREQGADVALENLLIAENGEAAVDSTTVQVVGESALFIGSSTVVNNNDSPLWADDTMSTVELRNSILYLNNEGPRVLSGVGFTRTCNNAQPVSAPSLTMGGSLGNPAFDGSAARGQYRLSNFSPSVDACISGPDQDADSLLRPNDGGAYDQGAFELNGAVPIVGISVLPSSGLTTSEAGQSDSFSVVLDAPPVSDVVIALASSDSGEGQPNVSSLTFTINNWNESQTVVVTGSDDSVADGPQDYQIVLDSPTTMDSRYAAIDPVDVMLTNQDDADSVGLLASAPDPLTTAENGSIDTFTVRLNSQPLQTVTVEIVSSDPGEGIPDIGQLLFDANNWMQPQTVSINGVDDAADDGDQNYQIMITTSSTDSAYDGLSESLNALNVDDDEVVEELIFADGFET